jgi:hypothetical protein
MADEVLLPNRPRCSPRRIEANRRNAKLSTGPKTQDGKRAVSRNAVKHGLTAITAIVENYENPDAFRKLLEGVREYYEPAGAMEDELVEEIAHCIWKKRRARTAEASAIHSATKAQAERLIMKSALEDPPMIKAFTLRVPVEDRLELLKGHIEGIRDVLDRFRKKHELDEYSKTVVNRFRNSDELFDLSRTDPELFIRALVNHLRILHESFEIAVPIVPTLPVPDLRLPDAESLELITRYETTITRRLYQSINQLERLQRRRGGEHIPPPIAWA